MTIARTSPSGSLVTSDNVANSSTVTGATVTAALDALAAADTPFAALSALLWVDRGTAIPTPSQTGSIALPKKTIQAAVNASPSTGAALYIVGANYSTEDISVVGGSKVMSFFGTDPTAVALHSLTAAAAFRAERLNVAANVAGSGDVELTDCGVFGTLGGVNLFLTGSPSPGTTFGIVIGATTATGGITADRWTFSNTTSAGDTLIASECAFNGATSCVSNATLTDCTLTSLSCLGLLATDSSFTDTVTVTGSATAATDCSFAALTCHDLTATTCSFSGAVSVTGDATLVDCTLDADLTVTGTLTIDQQTYNAALQKGHAVTAATITLLGVAALQKQLAWTGAVNSNLFTLVPAGAPKGLYTVALSIIANANLTTLASMGGTVVASGITKTNAFTFAASNFTTGATPRFAFATTEGSPRSFYSDGTSAVTLQLVPTTPTGSGSFDVYCGASRVAA